LRDIGALAARALDWEMVERQARQLGIQRILAVNFVLANRFLEAPIPEVVGTYLQKDGRVGSLVNGIAAKIARGRNCDVTSVVYFREFAALRERRLDQGGFGGGLSRHRESASGIAWSCVIRVLFYIRLCACGGLRERLWALDSSFNFE